MAADTAQKRYSAYDLGTPWRGVRVLPSGTVDAPARTAQLWLYSGVPGVVGTAPTITTTTLANGTQGEAYADVLVATGNAPITWSVSAGTMPTGVTLSSDGILSGTPTNFGTFAFTAQAVNAFGSDTQSLSFDIAEAVVVIPPRINRIAMTVRAGLEVNIIVRAQRA